MLYKLCQRQRQYYSEEPYAMKSVLLVVCGVLLVLMAVRYY